MSGRSVWQPHAGRKISCSLGSVYLNQLRAPIGVCLKEPVQARTDSNHSGVVGHVEFQGLTQCLPTDAIINL